MSDENKTAQEIAAAEAAAKVVFDDKQTARVNELIREAQGRAGNEARATAARLETEAATLRQQLADANAKVAAAANAGDKKDAKDDVVRLRAEIDEVKRAGQTTADELRQARELVKSHENEAKTAREEATTVRKTVAIQSAAAKANFVNTDVVNKLTADNIKWDATKGKFVVHGDNGQPRLNASFEDMSLDEFYTEFASKNPYLVRGDVKLGIGSHSGSQRIDVSNNGKFELKNVFGKDSSGKAAMELMKTNPAEYARLKVLAINSGLLQG